MTIIVNTMRLSLLLLPFVLNQIIPVPEENTMA